MTDNEIIRKEIRRTFLKEVTTFLTGTILVVVGLIRADADGSILLIMGIVSWIWSDVAELKGMLLKEKMK